jgi:hypothetical protein
MAAILGLDVPTLAVELRTAGPGGFPERIAA